MDSLLWILLGVGGVAVLSMKNKPEKEYGKTDGGKPGVAYPKVVKLSVKEKMVLPIKQVLASAPALWDASKVPSDAAAYPAIMADQAFLYNPSIKQDFLTLSAWLATYGMTLEGNKAIYDNITSGPIVGEVLLQFDATLPASLRAFTFWQVAAQKWGELNANLDSDAFKAYPLFRDSVRAMIQPGGIKPVGYYAKNGTGNPNPGGASKVDGDRPETWLLPDTDGPANIETPHGTLYVPKGGRIRDGAPEYTVQNGDYSGAVMAKKWGKKSPDLWAKAVASENPEETFGGSGNTVYVGDTLAMPIGFLDPTLEAPKGGSGGGKPGGGAVTGTASGKKNPPPVPGIDPGSGREWVWSPSDNHPSGGQWVSVPVDLPGPKVDVPDDPPFTGFSPGGQGGAPGTDGGSPGTEGAGGAPGGYGSGDNGGGSDGGGGGGGTSGDWFLPIARIVRTDSHYRFGRKWLFS